MLNIDILLSARLVELHGVLFGHLLAALLGDEPLFLHVALVAR